MSILQLELPDEMVRQLEVRAAARNLDLQSWMREQIETVLLENGETSWEEKNCLRLSIRHPSKLHRSGGHILKKRL